MPFLIGETFPRLSTRLVRDNLARVGWRTGTRTSCKVNEAAYSFFEYNLFQEAQVADGQECRNCGYQETAHELGRAKLASGEECRDFDPETREEVRQRLRQRAEKMLPIGMVDSDHDGE